MATLARTAALRSIPNLSPSSPTSSYTAPSRPMPFYPSAHSAAVLRSHKARSAHTCAASLLPLLRPTDTLLDIGCGPGTITASFAPFVARVTGVEHPSAAAVLVQARDEAQQQGLGKVEYVVADAAELPFEDGAFDVVYCNQVLQHVPDPVAVLREMHRVSRRLVFAREADRGTFALFPPTPLLARFDELWSLVARAGGGEPDAARRLKGWAHEAGCSGGAGEGEGARARAGQVTVTTAGETPDPREWGAVFAARTVEGGFADKAKELGFATEDELRRIGEAWSEWSEKADAWLGFLQGEMIVTKEEP
ncbi:hypothetical protein JCM9279_007492 [Rhodotorula babjevae]